MSQIQNEKDALLCVYGDCRGLQPEDGEYCEEHFNKMESLADDADIKRENNTLK